MALKYLTINFGEVIPPHALPKLSDVRLMVFNQLRDVIGEGKILVEQERKYQGFFRVTVLDPEIYDKLNGRHLTVDFKETERKKAPLISKKVRFTSTRGRNWKNPKWVKISKSFNYDMATIKDQEFNTFFARYGTIIEGCTSSVRDGTLTGQRSIKIDIMREIPRKIDIVFASTKEGNVVFEEKEMPYLMDDKDTFRAKGDILIYYDGQNYTCGRCSRNENKPVSHNKKCPLSIEDERKREEKKKQHEENVEVLMIGTSNLRCLDSLNTKARTLASSGARLGHTATQIKNQETERYKTLIIQTGDNNYDPDININALNDENADKNSKELATTYKLQQDKELKMLEQAILDPVHKKTTILITEPLKTPLHRTNLNIEQQRLRLKNKLRELADRRKKNGQKTIYIEHNASVHDSSSFDDKNHLNETGIHHLLDEIDFYHNIRLNKGPDTTYTTGRFYSGVTPIARMGCHYCCDNSHFTADCMSQEAILRMWHNKARDDQKTKTIEQLDLLQKQPLRTTIPTTNSYKDNGQATTKTNEHTTSRTNNQTNNMITEQNTNKTDGTIRKTETVKKRNLSDDSTKTDMPASKQTCWSEGYEIPELDFEDLTLIAKRNGFTSQTEQKANQ